jgi:type II secretory pathway pseudopilin PulG
MSQEARRVPLVSLLAPIASRIRAFTLIETLVAISLLVIAIVAPMSLVSQSLASAYFARDQVTAYNLAQEGIEVIRSVRDGNILQNAVNGTSNDLLNGISANQYLLVDATQNGTAALTSCSNPLSAASCAPLQADPANQLYGYCANCGGWTTTKFVRYAYVKYVGPASINGGKDEIRVTVTVQWQTATGLTRSFKMYSNMYRWIEDNAASG